MPIKTYKDPKTNIIYTETGEKIPDYTTYSARVRAGEISGVPEDVSKMPSVIRTQSGGIAEKTNLASSLSKLGTLNNQTAFMKAAEDIIKRKQSIQQPLTEAKAYWRTLQSDTTPFGGLRDPQAQVAGSFDDERMRLLSPTDQASVRASRFGAAQSHLAGITEEETYRKTRSEDMIDSMTDLFKEKADIEQKAIDNKEAKLRLQKLEMEIKNLGKESGYEIDDKGNVVTDLTGSTTQTIAAAIKKAESGGNYDAKGGSGENGAYQFMPATWAGWSRDYADKVLKQSTRELPMTPENQDAVAEWKIQSWLDQGYNARQIASMWNSGSPDWEGKVGVNKHGVNYNVPAYVNKVANILGTMAVPQKLSYLSELTGISIEELNVLSKEERELLQEAAEESSKADIKTEMNTGTNQEEYNKVTQTIKQEDVKQTDPNVIYAMLIRLHGERLSAEQIKSALVENGFEYNSYTNSWSKK